MPSHGREPFVSRRKRLLEIVKEDSVLVSDPSHIFYLTGLKAALELQGNQLLPHNPMVLGLSKAGGSFLIAGRTSLVDPFSDVEVLTGSNSLFDGSLYTYEDYSLGERVSAPLDFVAEELTEVMTEMKQRGKFDLGHVGVEERNMQLEVVSRIEMEFPGISISGISPQIRLMRRVKEESEFGAISQASERLRASIDYARRLVQEDMTESELFGEVSSWLKARYGEEAILRGMVLSGRRTSEVWGPPTMKRIEAGDPVILDFQTRVDGYFARSAVTIQDGAQGQDSIGAQGILSDALSEVEGSLRPGVRASDAFSAMAAALSKSGKERSLPHEAGHGVGLELREAPFLIPSSTDELVEGMAFCAALGLYSGSSGSRFASCYRVGKNGLSRL